MMEESDTEDALLWQVKSCFDRRKYDQVISLSEEILAIDREESMAWVFKGKAYLELDDYTNAINSFEIALDLGISPPEVARETSELLSVSRTKKTLNGITRSWYQTETHVIIHVMAKNMRRQHVHVLFEEKNIVCSMKIPPFNIFYDLFLNLARPIVPQNSFIVVLKNKVEIRMEKEDSGDFWEVLDLDTKAKYAKNGQQVKSFWKIPENDEAKEIDYQNWEELAAERERDIEKERLQDWDADDAIHRLFQDIYSHADEEKQKAMVKSFMDSRGKSMTTNWKNANKTVENIIQNESST